MTNPVVSVIIPCFNGAKYLSEAIDSVLRQNHEELEIIVSDDGSTDDSAAIARSYPRSVHYIGGEHRGLPAALNKGLKHANGTIIGFIDADDIWPEGRLLHQLNLLDKNPGVAVVAGTLQRFFDREMGGKHVRETIQENQRALSVGVALFRRGAFDVVGHFDEEHAHGNDIDWFMRAGELGVKILHDDRIALLYRRHDNNMSNNQIDGERYLLGIAKRALDRRRLRQKAQAESQKPEDNGPA